MKSRLIRRRVVARHAAPTARSSFFIFHSSFFILHFRCQPGSTVIGFDSGFILRSSFPVAASNEE